MRNEKAKQESDDEFDEEAKGDLAGLGFGARSRLTMGLPSGLANVDQLFDPEYQNSNYYYDEKDNVS